MIWSFLSPRNENEIAAMRAELSKPDGVIQTTSEMPDVSIFGWRPIETAPDNGDQILVYSPYGIDGWPEICIAFCKRKGQGLVYQHDDHMHVTESTSHWMPLPAFPKPVDTV